MVIGVPQDIILHVQQCTIGGGCEVCRQLSRYIHRCPHCGRYDYESSMLRTINDKGQAVYMCYQC
jgi:hypothetical protein